MPRASLLVVAAVALTSLGVTPACSLSGGTATPGHSVAMQDSFEIQLFGPDADDLHTPYVAGAKFGITIATTGYAATAPASWTLESADPTVVLVDGASNSQGGFQVTAVGPGHTTLSVVDAGGNVLDSHAVEVAVPDSVQLCSHGLLLGGLSDAQAQITQATILQEGTATFLVRYYQGAQELWGNNAVQATGTGAVTAATTTSSFGDDRDWVEVGASEAGTGQVSLAVAGSTMAVIPVNAVTSSAITSVGALAETDANATDGTTLYVFGRAFDSQGSDIYGGSFMWTANGTVVSGTLGSAQPSDVLAYTYKGSSSETISDGLGSFVSPVVTVHGTGATLDSTEDVGCSVARGAGAGTGAMGALVLGVFAAGTSALRRRAAKRVIS